ncbi:MAG TPA: hypothetical protein VIY52_28390 [Streptosporangiaceae bacterium]
MRQPPRADEVDIRSSDGVRASDSGAMTRCKIRGGPVDHGIADETLARVLITSWTLATGRTLRAGVPPQSHTADELISFWPDEQTAGHAPDVRVLAAGAP